MAAKACIVVVWFGKLPEYYRFWERSCGCNAGVADFLLVTDQDHTPSAPNVRVQSYTMDQLRERMERQLGLKVSLASPYKMCDFKPAYGKIFEELLTDYEYWGHCDLDQVYGDMRILLDRPDLGQYDKIGRSGHLTLYRNCPEMNTLYARDGALFDYKTVFTSPAYYAFDERTGVCRIAKQQKTAYLNIVDLRADLRVQSRRLEIYAGRNYKKQAFYWENGHLYRAFVEDGRLRTEEFIYIHFQKKKLADRCKGALDSFFVGREGFFDKTGPVCIEDLDRYNRADPGLRRHLYALEYYWKKLMGVFCADKVQRQVWVAQKRIEGEHYD